MTFLAPWALAAGALGALGVVLLHLVARQRPAAYVLPTARFIPDRQTLVSRAASRPRDLLLLLLRVLLLLLAGAAFAQPVLVRASTSHARVVVLDRSALVADPAAASRRARALVSDGTAAVLVTFDSAAAVMAAAPADSGRTGTTVDAGSLSAALVAARRAAGSLATQADSVELVLLSPVAESELDPATFAVRAEWPGAVRVERLVGRTDSASPAAMERTVPLADPLGPALVHLPIDATGGVRLRRVATATGADSAFARAGGTVVLWDSASAPITAQGLVVRDDVIVAPLGRRAAGDSGVVRARWADGTPAAREVRVGAGCIRTVGIATPATGDLPLRPGFQRVVRALVAPCGRASAVPASDSTLARISGGRALAPASVLADGSRAPSRIVPWLLGAALACALLELLLRRIGPRDEAAA